MHPLSRTDPYPAPLRSLQIRPGKTRLTGLLIAGLSISATLSLLEAGLRIADYPPDTNLHQRLFVEYDATRGWRNIPGADDFYSQLGEYRTHLQYNTRGMRGPERPYAKPQNTYRVVILGDSFVDGYSVAVEDRVSEVLEGLLDSAAFSGNPEVIALGTGGYSTDQELLWLESEGLEYHPDLVVVMFTNNDVWYNAQPRYWRGCKPLFQLEGDSLLLTNVPVPRWKDACRPGDVNIDPEDETVFQRIKDWLRVRFRLYTLISRAVQNTAWLHKLAIEIGLIRPAPETFADVGSAAPLPKEFVVFKKTETTPAAAEAWRITQALLRRVKQVSQEGNADLVVFYIPAGSSVYQEKWEATRSKYGLADDEWDKLNVARNLLRICAEEAIACIDPTERFVAVGKELAQSGERPYYEVDGHWNANGHHLAAEILAEYVLTDVISKAMR